MPQLIGLVDYDGCGDGDRGLMSQLGPKWTRAGNPITQAVESGVASAWPGGFGIRIGIDPLNGKGFVRRAHTALAQPIHVFYFKINAPSDFGEPSIILFQDGAITQFQVHVDAAGIIRIYNAAGFVEAFTPTGFWQAHYNVYKLLYIQATVHNSFGLVKVYVDEELVLQASSMDTQATANGFVNAVRWANGESQNIYIDDWLLLDWSVPGVVFPGPIRVSARQMNSDQTPLQWTPTPAGSHFSTVDELPFSASDFISTMPSGNIDMFGVLDDGVTGNPVAVRTLMQAKAQALPAIVRSRLRDGVDVASGAPWDLTAGSRVYDDLFALKPGGSPWDEPAVDGLHVGVEKV